MFSAGDNRYKLGLTPIQTAIVDAIAPAFCPVQKFGNDPVKKDDCDLLLAKVLADSTAALQDDEAKNRFTAEIFLPAAQTVGHQCQEQKAKRMVGDERQCSLDSYRDEKNPRVQILTSRDSGLLEMPFIPYLKAAAAGRVSGISGASIAGPTSTIVMLTRPVPTAKFSDFIKELKDGGMRKLAYEAMRLFNDAVEREDFDASKIDALVDSIIDTVKSFSDGVLDAPAEDKSNAIDLAHEILSQTIIYKFEADGKGDFRTLPEEVWGAGKNLVEKTGLRKLFTNAIPHYLKNEEAPAYAAADVTKALGELGAAMLKAIEASEEKNPAKLVVKEVKADDSGKPTDVIFMDKAAAAEALAVSSTEDTGGKALPKRLILTLGAGWNDIALEALKELWRAAYLKNIKLAKLGTLERERAIDSMIEQLSGASPVGIKSAIVEKVEKDGTVVLKNLPEKKFADRYLRYLSGLEGDMYIAFYDKINELHREAVDSSEFKDKKFTEDDVAAAIEKSLKDAIGGGKAGGLKKFADLHFKRGEENKTLGKIVPIFSPRSEWWRAKISLAGTTDFQTGFAGALSARFGGVHDVGKNLAVKWGIGLTAGADQNKFRVDRLNNSELILDASAENKTYVVLPEATVGVGSTNEAEHGKNKLNWDVTAGVKFDDLYSEKNLTGAWVTLSGLFSDVGQLSFEAGIGGMLDLDLSGERDISGGPFFFSGKLRGETKLWKDAKLEAGLWYLYQKGTSDVLLFDGTISQKLPKGFGVSATGMYAMDVLSDAPTKVGYFSPSLAWQSSEIFTFGKGKNFYFKPSAYYELLNVNGVNRHGLGLNFGIEGQNINGHGLLFTAGYAHYFQDAEAEQHLKKDVNEDTVVTAPGAQGDVFKFGLTFTY